MEQLKEFLWKGKPASLIHIEGEDSLDYLQSQLSNKIIEKSKTWTYALWLNRKGKVLADSYVFSISQEEFYLLSYYTPSEKMIPIIEANIIADDVEIEDLSSSYWLCSLFELDKILSDIPVNGFTGNFEDKIYFRGNRGKNCSYEILLKKNSKSDAQLKEIENKMGSLDENGQLLEQIRILEGIPRVGVDATDEDLPQECGLDHAISYNKGCYLGQEVMARIHAQGKVNRSLRKVELVTAQKISCPATIIDSQSGKAAGEIRSITNASDTVQKGLAIVKDKFASQDLELADNNQVEVSICSQ